MDKTLTLQAGATVLLSFKDSPRKPLGRRPIAIFGVFGPLNPKQGHFPNQSAVFRLSRMNDKYCQVDPDLNPGLAAKLAPNYLLPTHNR